MTLDLAPHTYIDSHAHLDDEQFEGDIDRVLARAKGAGVAKIVNIGYEPGRWTTSIALAERFPNVEFTLGLHPSESDQFSPELVDRLGELAERSGATAIGEIGIDLFRAGPSLELQQKSFNAQLALARELNLPVVIHQRSAAPAVAEALSNQPSSLKCILHSFEGDRSLMRLGVTRGYYFGIGGLMTRRSSDALRALIKEIPRDLMLLETDSPYLNPSGAEGRRNEPSNIPGIARALANILDIPLSDVADTTSRNAIAIFRLDSIAQVGATIS